MLQTLLLYAAVTCLAASLFLYLQYSKLRNYWRDRGVPFLDPLPVLGNTADWTLGRIHSTAWIKNIYDSSDAPYLGVFVFWMPRLMLRSPEIIKRVMVSDFDAFPNRNVAKSDHDEITNNMMFLQQTPSWKPMRTKLSPIFSGAKLRGMFPILNGVGEEMVGYIRKNLGVLEAKSVVGRYSTETICLTFFGVKAFSFEADSFIHDLVKQMNGGTFSTMIRQICYAFIHGLVNPLRLSFFPGKLQDPLADTLMEVLRKRKDSSSKGDFVDFLIDIKKDEEFCRTHNFVGRATAGPAIQFLFAGHETTSTTIAFTLYELAIHHEIQNRARKDILDAIQKYRGLTYDAIQDMKYLKMCVQETLRKYPVLSVLDRRCNRDYNIPGTDLMIRNGETVIIPVMGLHYDEKYFPQPENYIPERFENKMNVNGLYYLPFGEGPRACIGERFGLINAQTCLSYILKNFSVDVCCQTPIPMEFDKRTLSFISKTGVSLKFQSL